MQKSITHFSIFLKGLKGNHNPLKIIGNVLFWIVFILLAFSLVALVTATFHYAEKEKSIALAGVIVFNLITAFFVALMTAFCTKQAIHPKKSTVIFTISFAPFFYILVKSILVSYQDGFLAARESMNPDIVYTLIPAVFFFVYVHVISIFKATKSSVEKTYQSGYEKMSAHEKMMLAKKHPGVIRQHKEP